MNSILNSGEEENVLSLSYTHLPARLKPCFLYMGVFPEDKVIKVSRLIVLWVAEGFLKPNESQSLEETAESQLMELVGRNLILAHKWDIGSGKLKSFIIHDLLRDLSLRIAEKQNSLRAINSIDRQSVARDRRLVIDASIPVADLKVLQSPSLVRSLFHVGRQRARFEFRFLRVLDGDCSSDNLLNVMSSTFNTRFLAFNDNPSEVDGYRFFCPGMFRTYWPNLQTLSCGNGKLVYSLEIWDRKMPQLRHLLGREIRLTDPEDGFSLPLLQSLETVKDLRLSEELCKRIPNVESLGLWYSHKYLGGYECLGYLCRFEKLERLSLNFWYAHFHPLGFGDTPTLRLICLSDCGAACGISALNILEEQESLGNEALQVRIKVIIGPLPHSKEIQETLVESAT